MKKLLSFFLIMTLMVCPLLCLAEGTETPSRSTLDFDLAALAAVVDREVWTVRYNEWEDSFAAYHNQSVFAGVTSPTFFFDIIKGEPCLRLRITLEAGTVVDEMQFMSDSKIYTVQVPQKGHLSSSGNTETYFFYFLGDGYDMYQDLVTSQESMIGFFGPDGDLLTNGTLNARITDEMEKMITMVDIVGGKELLTKEIYSTIESKDRVKFF